MIFETIALLDNDMSVKTLLLCGLYLAHFNEVNGFNINGFNINRFNVLPKKVKIPVELSLSLVLPLLLINPLPSPAFDEPVLVPVTPPSITQCPPQTKNCISSSNIKDITKYSPPWSYSTSTEEAFKTLKNSISSDPNLRVTSSYLPSTSSSLSSVESSSPYITASASRAFKDQDALTFLFKPSDSLILFTTKENNDDTKVPDFGAQRSRLKNLRVLSGFGEMGQGFGSADVAGKKESFGTQLKSFYGLQSGKGWEDIYED